MKYCFILFIFIASSLSAQSFHEFSIAKVQLLNKFTGNTKIVNLYKDKLYIFEDKLYIILRNCYKASQQDEPENEAFIQMVKHTSERDKTKTHDLSNEIPIPKDFEIKGKDNYVSKFIFSGWLFSSSPSLTYLEDQMYDITLLQCVVKE